MKTLLNSLVFIAVCVPVALFLGYVSDKNATVECNTWKEQARTIDGFYLTASQGEQCDTVGVETGAIIVTECLTSETPVACQARLGSFWEVLQYEDGTFQGERI